MKTLYLDLGMGAAGDMLTGALLELTKCPEEALKKINDIGLKDVKTRLVEAEKCGIKGTKVEVLIGGRMEGEEHDYGHHHAHDHDHGHHHDHDHDHDHDHEHTHNHHHDHSHNGMFEIEKIVSTLNVSDKVKQDVLAIYNIIAEAESKAHGVTVSKIHFHEVGMMDAVSDITACCLLMEELGIERVVASPINTGSGTVKCAHGILPVPAPATLNILKDCPIYSSDIKGELCTPTGAAIIKYFADEFSKMPLMSVQKIGYGMGTKDFAVANCVRAVLGESHFDSGENDKNNQDSQDKIVELICTIDDMTGEELSFATQTFLKTSATDVYTVPAYMKKGRPGVELHILCTENNKDATIRNIFKYTSTIGIRENICKRYVLDRKEEELQTELGKIRKKTASGYGIERYKLEYEDLKRIAEQKNVSIAKARELAEKLL